MATKQIEVSSESATAGPRLPNFGAEASVGPASRSYRSPLSFFATGSVAAVAPSQWSEGGAEAGTDTSDDADEASSANDMSGEMDDDNAGDQDADEGVGDDASDEDDDVPQS